MLCSWPWPTSKRHADTYTNFRSLLLQIKQAMTLTEKILARKSGKSLVKPGDNTWTECDKLMTHDVCGPGTFGIFQKEFGENAKLWNPEKVVIIPDHYIFTSDSRANRNVDILREMAEKYNIKYFYDIQDRSNFKANPNYKGVCHIALAEGLGGGAAELDLCMHSHLSRITRIINLIARVARVHCNSFLGRSPILLIRNGTCACAGCQPGSALLGTGPVIAPFMQHGSSITCDGSLHESSVICHESVNICLMVCDCASLAFERAGVAHSSTLRNAVISASTAKQPAPPALLPTNQI
eukprot:scaffold20468_cov21-Tisochrysis_lutea.AAC.1